MLDNPFVKEAWSTLDVRNGLADIKSDIEHLPELDQVLFADIMRDLRQAQELTALFERTQNLDDHIGWAMHLSGLEIKMTTFANSENADQFPDLRTKMWNFADTMRRKFA